MQEKKASILVWTEDTLPNWFKWTGNFNNFILTAAFISLSFPSTSEVSILFGNFAFFFAVLASALATHSLKLIDQVHHEVQVKDVQSYGLLLKKFKGKLRRVNHHSCGISWLTTFSVDCLIVSLLLANGYILKNEGIKWTSIAMGVATGCLPPVFFIILKQSFSEEVLKKEPPAAKAGDGAGSVEVHSA